MTQPTPADPGRETRVIDLKGRQVVVRQLTDAQQLLMSREATLLRKDNIERDRKMVAVGRIYDMLESAVVQPDDLEYVTELNVSGNLELKDMMEFVSVFGKEEDKPRVRRGRPPTKRA